MAYDQGLAERIRMALKGRKNISEREMFGGLAFLSKGRMFCGIAKDELMVRVGTERHVEALAKPHVRAMDFTGRPMKGYVFVDPAGLKGTALKKWIQWSLDVVAALPPKT